MKIETYDMSYEKFKNRAAINNLIERIPSKITLIGAGVGFDKDGCIKYKDKTFMPNRMNPAELPEKIRHLFIKNSTEVEIKAQPVVPKEVSKLGELNDVLFVQLQNIIDPEKDTDISQELKKANTICNVADKIINIADLSLRAEKFRVDKILRYI